MCFFFQAEDGIRDLTVTGVQTCALPIFSGRRIPARFPVRKDGLVADERPSHHFGRFRHLSQGDVRCGGRRPPRQKRKSTRLKSTHSQKSYAVFSLKKKKI